MHNKTKNAGLWIDHRDAMVVLLTEAGHKFHRLYSYVERQSGHSNASGNDASGAHRATADDARGRDFTGHLARFYDEIIALLHDMDTVLIIGPGEAKGELQKRFAKHPSGSRSIVLETADKMTEPQVVALVRHHFHCDPARR